MQITTSDLNSPSDSPSGYKQKIDDNFTELTIWWMRLISGGYIAGGQTTASPVYSSTIEYFNFGLEKITLLSETLSGIRDSSTGVQSSQKGYYGGGYNGSRLTVIDSLNFITEVLTTLTDTITARNFAGGVQSSTNGYFGGGVDSATSPIYKSDIYKLSYADETTSVTSATVSPRNGLTGVSSSTHGYFGGGTSVSASPNYSNEIDGITFSTEATYNPSATLSVSRSFVAGIYSSSIGYWGGGYNLSSSPSYKGDIDGIIFSTDTATNPSASLTVKRSGPSGVSNSDKGFFCGGLSPTIVSEIDGLKFSTIAAINPSASLIVAKEYSTGTSYR